MSRPRIALTDTIRQRLLEALRIGASYALAAQYAGISEDTLSRWIRQGDQPSGRREFAELCEQITKARAHCAISALVTIEKAAPNDWRAAAWKLTHLQFTLDAQFLAAPQRQKPKKRKAVKRSLRHSLTTATVRSQPRPTLTIRNDRVSPTEGITETRHPSEFRMAAWRQHPLD